MEFVVELLRETGVLIVNGSGFDPVYGKDHAKNRLPAALRRTRRSLQRLERFMRKKQKTGRSHVGHG